MERARKNRVAIGIFYDLDRLQEAVDDLNSCGPAGAQMRLLAQTSGIDHVAFGKNSSRFADNKAGLSILAFHKGKVTATDGGTADDTEQMTFRLPLGRIFQYREWLDPRFTEIIRQCLGNAGFVLWIPVTANDDETEIGRILLTHADGQVQFHDFPSRVRSPGPKDKRE